MKQMSVILSVMISLLMVSCEYFGEYEFEVANKSGETVVVSYYEQRQCTEDYLPTYEHGEDYDWIRVDDTPTKVVVKSDTTYRVIFQIGMVSKDWPTEDDTPERYHIVPMWDRIDYIAVGTDTLDAACYSKDKWSSENGSRFTLTIR